MCKVGGGQWANLARKAVLRTFTVVKTSVCVCSNIHRTKLVVMYHFFVLFQNKQNKVHQGKGSSFFKSKKSWMLIKFVWNPPTAPTPHAILIYNLCCLSDYKCLNQLLDFFCLLNSSLTVGHMTTLEKVIGQSGYFTNSYLGTLLGWCSL